MAVSYSTKAYLEEDGAQDGSDATAPAPVSHHALPSCSFMVLVLLGPSRGASGGCQRPMVMPQSPGFTEQKAVTLLEVTGLGAQGSSAVVSRAPVVHQDRSAGGRGKPSEAAWVWRKEGRDEVAGGCW